MVNDRKVWLAKEFFGHDVRNKENIRDGRTNLIEMRGEEGEYAPNDEKTHENARKAWKAQKEISELEEEAERVLSSNGGEERDVQKCVEKNLDNLESVRQLEDKDFEKNYNSDNTVIETHPTFDNMLYNLLDNSIRYGESEEIEITLENYSEGLELEVMDGSNIDFNDVLPGTLDREDYTGTGTYLIDHVLDITDIEVEDRDEGYAVLMPQ